MSEVIWKVIPGYSNYSASNTGQVRRDVRLHNAMPGPVTISLDSRGYPASSITADDGKSRKVGIHQLVALAFIGERPPGLIVCHNNGNPLDSTPTNLRYDTHKGNGQDMARHGTSLRGEKHKSSKLTEPDVVRIRELLRGGELSNKQIGAMFGVSGTVVSNIARFKTWAHVGGDAQGRLPPGYKKLNVPKVKEVKRMLGAGVPHGEIADSFDVSVSTVKKIADGRSWKGVTL